MRDVATRRREQSQFLAAWGAEMVRVHLHHIEKVELDTRPLREAILSSTGGIPSETIKLIAAMRVAADPIEEARGWKATLRVPAGLLNGALGRRWSCSTWRIMRTTRHSTSSCANISAQISRISDPTSSQPDSLASGSQNPDASGARRLAIF
ncbi:hypothetical protein [Frigidibacter mobilis]|uniref:hypothetical protein n=1 Tax=Frigidibacter mobilis TaxID=1335048 RepID=UPI00083416EF|nr:hypothetical protein [Frigidibacter mobilis]